MRDNFYRFKVRLTDHVEANARRQPTRCNSNSARGMQISMSTI